MGSRYDRAVTVFSPDGHLLQVEYAQEAVRKGSTAVGVRGKDVVVLGVEKRSTAKLQEERTVRKICLLDQHVLMAFAGLTADARILINRAQVECQSHKLNFEDPVTLEYITRYIAGLKQRYTQSNGRRPFGISCLIGGFDYDGQARLYHTDPSGIFYEWKANATGRAAKTVHEFLEKYYKDEEVATNEGAIKLAIRALLEVVQSGQKTLEVAVMHRDKPLEMLDADTIDKFVKEIEAEKPLLEYDSSGLLVKQTKKARPVGTTVSVEELFKPLAVRYKDFHRNIKKHYAKLLKVLQAYAVSCANVKICVFNITGKNASRHVVLATQAHQTMGENIANVFGTKFFRTLLRVDFELKDILKAEKDEVSDGDSDSEQKSSFVDTGDDLSSQERKVEGFVSKVGAGVGRSDNDRQFFFINGRPFDLPKMAKTLNEVWRQYEMKQKPACVLNFHLPLGDYDVNVTPDKRETFVKHEAELIDAFKTGLNKLYEPSRGTFTVQPLMTTFARATKAEEAAKAASTPETDSQQSKRFPAVESREEDEVTMDSIPTSEPLQDDAIESEEQKPKHVIVEILQPENQRSERSASPNDVEEDEEQKTNPSSPPSSPEQILLDLRKPKRQKLYSPIPSQSTSSPSEEHVWSLDEMLKQRQQYFEEEVEYEQKRKSNRLSVPKACSASIEGAAVQADNDVAAAALQRVLKKEDFKRMEVLGQFNLGFIIGKLDNDLFIIDQHASDEKFNYETLQQTTIMHQQPLVRPLMLELTAGEEMVILDHLDVFAKNGFTFLVDKDAPATKKLKLLSLPFTKHTQFGTEDIRELASLLMDAPLNPSTIRLPKVMTMFASRACRSSIMIGTALHKEEMQKIVRNLSGLDQPWNCPHGRPTLRHLVDLLHLEDNDV